MIIFLLLYEAVIKYSGVIKATKAPSSHRNVYDVRRKKAMTSIHDLGKIHGIIKSFSEVYALGAKETTSDQITIFKEIADTAPGVVQGAVGGKGPPGLEFPGDPVETQIIVTKPDFVRHLEHL